MLQTELRPVGDGGVCGSKTGVGGEGKMGCCTHHQPRGSGDALLPPSSHLTL